MRNNSNEKSNSLINVQKLNEKQIINYVTQQQTITTEVQASDLGQAHTYRIWPG